MDDVDVKSLLYADNQAIYESSPCELSSMIIKMNDSIKKKSYTYPTDEAHPLIITLATHAMRTGIVICQMIAIDALSEARSVRFNTDSGAAIETIGFRTGGSVFDATGVTVEFSTRGERLSTQNTRISDTV
ncbi:hypothetical protein EVAR_66724_1 [Eumeta japonica]|uniref:Uncharacterized protein n=1 Tax=Eumeta variegata TaxID=151549 RepID=A0A4C2A329_EUMVA|nr:hypothetical protein EVAR_66724_1 [Eumeta japonica]